MKIAAIFLLAVSICLAQGSRRFPPAAPAQKEEAAEPTSFPVTRFLQPGSLVNKPIICAYILSEHPQYMLRTLFGPKVQLSEVVEMLLYRPETTGGATATNASAELKAKRQKLLPKFLQAIRNTILFRVEGKTACSPQGDTLSFALPYPTTSKLVEIIPSAFSSNPIGGRTWERQTEWKATVPPKEAWLFTAFRHGDSYIIVCQPWAQSVISPGLRDYADVEYQLTLPTDQQGAFIGFDIIKAIPEMLKAK